MSLEMLLETEFGQACSGPLQRSFGSPPEAHSSADQTWWRLEGGLGVAATTNIRNTGVVGLRVISTPRYMFSETIQAELYSTEIPKLHGCLLIRLLLGSFPDDNYSTSRHFRGKSQPSSCGIPANAYCSMSHGGRVVPVLYARN